MAGGTLYGTGATGVGTFDSILKEFYLGPVQEQINQEVFALEMFEKATVDWNGKHAIIPVHTGRNTSVAFKKDGESLTATGSIDQQEFKSLTVKAKFLYGQFMVTGPAISAAAKGSTNSFISYVDAEMSKLVEDVRDSANKACITGGRVKGFISDRATSFDVAATSEAGAVHANVIYDGDFSPFTSCAQATGSTWVRVHLYRMDTYAEILVPAASGVAGTVTGWFISDGSAAGLGESTGLLELSAVSDGNAAAVTLAIDNPYAIAVVLHSTRMTSPATIGIVPTGDANTSALSTEVTGIFGSLGDPSHFGEDRSTASGTTGLQSYCVTFDEDATVARDDVTLARMQAVIDNVLKLSGVEPDQILMSPLQRQKYVAQVGGNIQTDGSKVTKADGGFVGLSFGGIPIETSRAVPNGCMLFVKTDTWKLCELEAPGFADLDGNVLSRVSATDAYEGFYRWYWNLVCTRPNANAILTGLTL